MQLLDALGTFHPRDPAARIVSLVPSITELLCDLGLGPHMVGRTGFCIHPADTVRAIAKVGGTKNVNVEKIRKLAPTHVIVNIDENEKPAADRLAEFVPHLVVTHPMGPRDNLDLARLMGAIFGVEPAAEAWCQQFEHEYALLHAMPKGPPAKVLYCIWQDPWMTVSRDTYIARMLAEIGWSVPAIGDQRYPQFSWSDALVAQLDGVLLSTEPYSFRQEHADALERQIGKPVWLVDGEMMSWYGSRSVAGLRYLREMVQQRSMG